MQLFQVKDAKGELVMNAPLETLRWVLKLHKAAEMRLLTETVNLENECHLHFQRFPACGRWDKLTISRLPLEIPAPTSDDLTARRTERAASMAQTTLGELLCDQ